MDHHLNEDQTHKVLKFPQRKELQKDNQEAYFAGIIDGEGWISYEKASKPNSDYRIPCIGVEMTDKDVVERFAAVFDLKVYGPYQRKRPLKDGSLSKPSWEAKATARDKVFEIVAELYPELGERRRAKCDEFVEWYEDVNRR